MIRLNIQLFLTLAFVAVSFAMLFFSPFGPINSKFIPFNPTGWAGIFVYLAMVTCYSQKYEKSRDAFWFILTLAFFPLLISDLYFFPIPQILGFGMFEWAAIWPLVFLICFSFFGESKILRYTNLLTLISFPVFVAVFKLPQLGIPEAFRVLPFLYLIIITITLSYYSFLRKEYLLIAGVVLVFIVSGLIVTPYLTNGLLLFGWSQPFMAVVTDRIAIFGRILMVLGPLISALRRLFRLTGLDETG